MGSILHITGQLNAEWTHLHPQAVFYKIERGDPIPLGHEGERKWAVPRAVTIVEEVQGDDEYAWSRPYDEERAGM